MTTTSLVLGSSGLIGGCLCRYLGKRGKSVVLYDIRRDSNEDLRHARLDVHQIDDVYLLAWEVGGSRYLYHKDTQEIQLEWNLRLLTNTIPQLKKSGLRWLFVSSQLSGQPNAYGITKSVGEYWAQLAGGRVVRLWNVYGEVEEENNRSHVISDMIRNALTTGEIHLLTDGNEKRRFIFETDICRGLETAIFDKTDEIFELAGPDNISVIEVAEHISRMTGAELYPGKGKSNWMGSSSSNMLPGFMPLIGIEEGLGIMIERYQEIIYAVPN